MSAKARRLVEELVGDLLHKPIIKHSMTRLFYHPSTTPADAQKAYDIVKRREALSNDFFEPYLTFCATHGLTSKIKEGIDEAAKANIPPPPDNWHNVYAVVHAHNRDLAAALRNLNQARKLGVYDGRAHDIVVRKMCHAATESALQVKSKSREDPLDQDVIGRKLEVDTVVETVLELARTLRKHGGWMFDRAYQKLVELLMIRGRYYEALEIAQWAEDLGYDPVTAEIRFCAAASQGELHKALKILDEVPRKKYILYSLLCSNCGGAGDLKTWLEIIQIIMDQYPYASMLTWSQMIEILGKRGAFEDMERVFSTLARTTTPNVHVYASMILMHTNGGNLARARELMQEVKAHGVKIEFASEKMLLALQQRSMWTQCDELIAEWLAHEVKGPIKLARKFKWWNLASMFPYWAAHKNTHSRCIAILLELDDESQRLHAFNEFLAELAKLGDVLSCVNTMREMRARNIKPDEDSFCSLYRAATVAHLKGAQDLLSDVMKRYGVKPNAKLRLAMIRYYIAVRNIRACESLVRELCDAYTDAKPMPQDQKEELSKALEDLRKLKQSGGKGNEGGKKEGEAGGKEENNQRIQKKKGKLKNDENPSPDEILPENIERYVLNFRET